MQSSDLSSSQSTSLGHHDDHDHSLGTRVTDVHGVLQLRSEGTSEGRSEAAWAAVAQEAAWGPFASAVLEGEESYLWLVGNGGMGYNYNYYY